MQMFAGEIGHGLQFERSYITAISVLVNGNLLNLGGNRYLATAIVTVGGAQMHCS